MQSLEQWLSQYDQQINRLDGTISSKATKITEKNQKINELTKDREENILKKTILSEACKTMREVSSDIFANICTSGIRTIMDEDLTIKIVHGERGGVPISDFKLCSNFDGYATELDPGEDECGGGIADIVALASLLTMNILNRDQNSAPILLDEPTKYVSVGNAARVGQFINDIAKQFDKQIVMVTHAGDTAKYADTIIHVKLDESGRSVATII